MSGYRIFISVYTLCLWGRSGSVVECLTRDWFDGGNPENDYSNNR